MEKRKPTYEELERRCRDLEAQTAHAAQIQEHGQYLATILETTHDGFIAINAKGILADANEAYCRMSGYTREELLKLKINDIDANETSDDTAARLKRIEKTGRETFETRHRRKDGSMFTVEVSVSYYPEKLPFLICFCRDVTERQQAEEKLRYTSERLQAVMEHSPLLISEISPDGRYLQANQAVAKFFNQDASSLTGKSFDELFSEDKIDLFMERITRVMETRHPISVEDHLNHPDGDRHYLTTLYPLLDDSGNVRSIGSIAHDITFRVQVEEKLHLLARMLDEAPDSITIHDANGRFLYANRKTFALHGYDENEFMAINLHDLDVPDSEALISERYQQIEKNGEATFEVAHFRRYGTSFPLSVHTKSIEWNGKAAVLSIATDITERKKTEKALQESEEKYRTLVDNAEEGILVAQDGMLKFANRYLAGMLEGYTEQEIISLPFSTFIHPDDRDMVLDYHTRRLNGESVSSRYIFRIVTRDGITKWIEMSAVIIEWNGRPASQNFLTDITERKKTEDALRESEQRFRSVVENANDIVYTLSPEGIFTYVSPNWLDILGVPAEEITGNLFELYVHPDDVHFCRDSMKAMLKKGEKQSSVEYRVKHADGSWRWHVSNGAPLRGKDGSLTGFIGIARDVTDRKQAENALRESEHRFRSFIENANDIVYTLSPEGVFTYVSPNWLDSFGEPAEKVTGRSFELYVHPDDVPLCHNFLEKVLTTGEKQSSVEYRVKHAEGSWRWHVSNGSPLRGEDGSVTSYVGIARDVTDRKQAEIELQKQSEAMEASIDGMAILDQNEIYTYVNTAHAEVYGYSDPGELLGKSWRILYNSDELERFENDIMPELSRNGKWSGETVGKKKDGSLFPQDISLTALQGGGLICLVRDATARKHAETELQRQKNLLQKIFDILPVGLWFIDKNGTILSRNAAGSKIWGIELYIDPLEYRRFKARRLPSGEEIAPDDWALQHTIREGVTIEDELLEIDAFDGKKRVILNSTAPVLDEQGEIQGAIGVNQDITEYQKLQEQLVQSQKMESVGRLAGGVAHDFNNMLAVVLGNVQFAMEQADPSLPLYEYLKEIEKAAERSAALTRQLLAFARRQTAEPKILDLNEKVTGTINMLQRLIGEDIKLVWKPGKDLPNVYIDPSQIDQVLANLCVNARDAIKDVGTVIIESGSVIVDKEYCDEHEGFTPGGYVTLSVSDDGFGMDKSILSNIFDPFFTTKEQGKGTGLGLATVYGIVRQNNGFINVYSEKGQGTTFKIYLARYYSESQELESHISPRKMYNGSETILLVEDEPQLLELSRKFLKKLGYEAITASSPAEAVRIAGDYPGQIHLLITDIVMPEMNGRDLARRLRASCPNMKFLFMSGYTADVIAHHGVLEDGVQFIQKPFSLHDFSAKIKETLKEE